MKKVLSIITILFSIVYIVFAESVNGTDCHVTYLSEKSSPKESCI